MRFFSSILIFLLAVGVPAALCFGGTLSISSRSTLKISTDRIQVDVFTENKGDEPAFQVQAHLYIFDRKYSSATFSRLEMNQNRIFEFRVPLPPDLKGEFPFVGEVLYHDINRLPVSTLSAGTFKLGSSGEGLLSGRAPELVLTANRSLSVEIRSRDTAPRDVVATLYLPRVLTTIQKEKKIRLMPFGTATVDFPLAPSNRAGGAIYPVFCILTSSAGGSAQAAIVQTAVEIKNFQNWFVRTRWLWLSSGGLIILGWIWIGIRKKD